MGSLRHLGLNSANFSGVIPHQLGNLSGLLYLNLGGNSDLYADNLRWMSNLSSIQYLDLSFANLHKEVDWLQIISKFPSLLKLYLADCQLDSLNPSLGFVNFTSLQVLYLPNNHFNHEIPNWFSNISTSLLVLDLRNCSLKGEIPHGILNFQKLKSLLLNSNLLTGKIPESLGRVKHLINLDLRFNSLSGPIPSSIGNLSYLGDLFLYDNQLNGNIPKSLGLLSNLKALLVGYNLLTGTVDEGHFTKLSKLKYLDMSFTSLFFNVNSNWVPPFQLEYAWMSSCKIGPNFPTWLQTQRSLKILEMFQTGISDKAPSWLWNWTSSIEIIDLSSNRIEGHVSGIVLNSTILNLRSNHFKGRMPQLSTKVKVLNIANNSIYGSISNFLCQQRNVKNKLEILDASNNLLSGELSHCWKYWPSLIRLNFGSNNISGRIPYSMSSLVALQSLHLQNNSIIGEIPSSLKICSNLRLIDISDNHLSDIIPLWIGDMTNLLILRLRSNRFKGHIPLQICQISSLRVLDLANNSLSGTIPKCLKNIVPWQYGNPIFETSLLILYDIWNELEYEKNLAFVKIIDLSSNNLSGSIPVEISILSELRFLNLSRNHLMGNIPEKIGSMKELESIDLSQNHLSGKIPPSLSNLTFLSHLDLSYNNFIGKIPLGTQLQSFDALSYIGNPQLYGDPLPKSCTIEEEYLNKSPIGKKEDEYKSSSFYIGMGVGFTTSFCAICGTLFFNRTYRHAYFRFADYIKDWIYVTTVLKMNWLLKKIDYNGKSKENSSSYDLPLL
ncbi:receptor-like protein EIX2 [Quercus robur]|uniref:receptor-like protein EIX2 n=1 Tax=Quercus robur TaxID=38942 RepID=UPI00216342EE|nr:receptor-like protein EIX2 [Quercus robur]